MTFFLFLFFFVFFALILIALQAAAGIKGPHDELVSALRVSVAKSEVEQYGDVDNVESILSALQARAANELHSLDSVRQSALLADTLSVAVQDIAILKAQALMFKFIVAGFALMFGFIAALMAIADGLPALFSG